MGKSHPYLVNVTQRHCIRSYARDAWYVWLIGTTADCRYQLMHLVRTHAGANDNAYRCVFQEEDDDDIVGVNLGRDLMDVAGVVKLDSNSSCHH